MPIELPAVPNSDIPGVIGLGGASATMLDPSRTDMRNLHSLGHHPLGHNGHGNGDPVPDAGTIAFTQAENRELRAEVDRLRPTATGWHTFITRSWTCWAPTTPTASCTNCATS